MFHRISGCFSTKDGHQEFGCSFKPMERGEGISANLKRQFDSNHFQMHKQHMISCCLFCWLPSSLKGGRKQLVKSIGKLLPNIDQNQHTRSPGLSFTALLMEPQPWTWPLSANERPAGEAARPITGKHEKKSLLQFIVLKRAENSWLASNQEENRFSRVPCKAKVKAKRLDWVHFNAKLKKKT